MVKLAGIVFAVLSCIAFANGLDNRQTFALNALDRLVKNSESPNKLVNDEDYFKFLNNLIFKWTSLVLQTGKFLNFFIADYDLAIPVQFKFETEREECHEDNCYNYHEEIVIGGYEDMQFSTYIRGQAGNDAQVKFGTSNFSYVFTVNGFSLDSSDFKRIETNLDNDDQLVWNGLNVAIRDTTLGLQLDFGLYNGVFNVSNLDLIFDYGEMPVHVPEVLMRENGTWRDLGELDMDFAPFVMSLLKETDESGNTVEERYEAHVESKINDLLAGRI